MRLFRNFILAALAVLTFSASALPAFAAPGQRVYSVWTYKNLVGAATTNVKAGAGILHTFCINTAGTTVVVFDSLAGSGNKIGSWTTTAQGCFALDVQYTVGLTFVTVGTSDITVAYQ